ncbi:MULTISPECIES: ribbon-helix-helix domain-containing protein [unclassified Acidiplasma]|uniref:ribbon-helix-helix domain-containing protein n=1 Tax=unclassified Acidiplasma TaxID=2641301 RepID=UPI0005E4F8DD|nr:MULTISPECIES: ribbon-helix-helix domain-containing protein [unclassified Acidiplasma]KJE49419.1 hypothetical protein TZ01_05145 [Acidiplasma sp. MBA-1]WMT54616.1 MAG: ribbon-helix-helix domain-containing protein [Acidiplasma sp.]
MDVPYRITIRVSEDLVKKLQDIVNRGKYDTISDAIREAINDFIKKNEENPVSDVDVKLPGKIYSILEEEVKSGNAVSVEDLIRFILREYAKSKTKN